MSPAQCGVFIRGGKMYKALRNFKSNGVKKLIGEKINKQESEKIKEYIDELLDRGIIVKLAEPVKKVAKKVVKKEEKAAE